MNSILHVSPHVYEYVVLPIFIFFARILDVTIGTIRIMLVARGKKYLSPILGFIEMLIWILVIRQVILSISNWVCYAAFAFGFAAGNYVGMLIEEKIALGMQVIRIITRKESGELMDKLKEAGYGITVIDAQGSTGKVNLIFTIVKRCDQPRVIALVRKFNPKAFYSIEDIRSVGEGIFPSNKEFLSGVKK